MNIRVGTRAIDVAVLERLGAGTYGEVYALDNDSVIKILNEPTEEDGRKILDLCSTTADLVSLKAAHGTIAVPTQEAYDATSQVCGFAMAGLFRGVIGQRQPWPPIVRFAFNLALGEFREVDGFRFDDRVAAATLLKVFQLLHELEIRRLVFCDLSGTNILFDPERKIPGLIDADSFKHQKSESSSLGTAGYLDPRLTKLGISGAGGYHFDAKSDIYAATVLSHILLFGVNPFSVPTTPPMDPERAAEWRLTWPVLMRAGDAPFRARGLGIVQNDSVNKVRARYAALDRASERLPDVRVLLDHLFAVFVDDDRENPILSLPERDPRSPVGSRLDRMGDKGLREELKRRYQRTAVDAQAPVTSARVMEAKAIRDPAPLTAFLAARGIVVAVIVEAHR